MIKLLKYTEYLYLVVAAMSIYKIVTLWDSNSEDAYIFIFFAVISLVMFAFRRKYRKRFEQRKNMSKQKPQL